ncbi:MAG: bis(5'-nucleosyl)-tetraphosphatase (symmetrical) YqeK [Bacillota bacterium]|nr:bis(5'-nucleosyl)-tetraphosphatase (symmetrical) YqeK [Bacillota bacterium]
MSEERYIHSINVATEAVFLAKKYGADEKKAEIAGILHDITKETPKEEQLQIIAMDGIILDDVEKAAPKLWHSISGAAFIKNQLQITDEDIINAVRYHTTARQNMSLLEKVIFVADFTGAERNYPGVEIMRQKSYLGLEEAMAFGLSFSIKDLAERNKPICRCTIDAFNQIIIGK